MHPVTAEAQVGDTDVVGGRRLLAGGHDDLHAADALAVIQPEFRLRIGRLLQSRAVPGAVRARVRPVLRRVGGHAMVVPDASDGFCREARLPGPPSAVAVLRRDGESLASGAVAGDPRNAQRGRPCPGELRSRAERRRSERLGGGIRRSSYDDDHCEPQLAVRVTLRLADTEHDSAVHYAVTLTSRRPESPRAELCVHAVIFINRHDYLCDR